jgi:CubicO group peptidase (beta-lactamase class C family)
MKKIAMIVLALVSIPYILIAQEYAKRIDSLVAQYTDNAEFAGSVLVVKSGRLLLKKGYGYSHAEQLTPHDANTIFNIASLTKPFTAALILKLAEDGKLSIDDQLDKYYPAYPGAERIRLRHLLTHTTGIPNYTDDKNFWRWTRAKN